MSTLRHSIRLLFRTPALTSAALLSIALSLGATAVVFPAVKSVHIVPLPYENAYEMIQIRGESAKYRQHRRDAARLRLSDAAGNDCTNAGAAHGFLGASWSRSRQAGSHHRLRGGRASAERRVARAGATGPEDHRRHPRPRISSHER